MSSVKPRREIYVETTRRVLLETGRQYFQERGYADVSAEELVRAAGLSRGALYHHFGGKPGLFEAVFEDVADDAAGRIGRAMAAARGCGDEQMITGIETFLDVCADPGYREIVLIQGPIALGWDRWHELDQRHLRSVLGGSVASLVESGLLKGQPPALLTAALYGMLTELAREIANADDPAQARACAARIVHTFLNAFRV